MNSQDGASNNELILLPSLQASLNAQGQMIMTYKYLSGAETYARQWQGPTTSLVRITGERSFDMDQVPVDGHGQLHRVERRPEDPKVFAQRIANAGLVMAFLSPYEAWLAPLCQSLKVPLVYGSEYTLRTEMQIVDANTKNPLLRLRRKWWLLQAERKRRKALALAAGIQCSGTPCYEAYRHCNDNAFLFFDNRVPLDQVITEQALEAKLKTLTDRPLRLAFGGRLIAMKGVLALPAFAAALKSMQVPFTLDIYGQGDLTPVLQHQINKLGLQQEVLLRGVLDFASGWIPMLQRHVDLFICPHPQGDPSSTYPEVMSCGVPIVGFANEAFSGIVGASGSGWLVPLDDAQALAAQVATLYADPAQIRQHARSARTFALAHAFEPTYARRVAHLKLSQQRALEKFAQSA